jgi:DNA-binding Lrp family transcriptional regulator
MGVKAYVLITSTVGSEYEVLGDLMKMAEQGVSIQADVVYGVYDIVVVVEASDLNFLDRVVSNIRRHPKVVKTVTLISSAAK